MGKMIRLINLITKATILIIWTIMATFLMITCMVRTVDMVGSMNVSYNHDSPFLNVIYLVVFFIVCMFFAYIFKNKKIKCDFKKWVSVGATMIVAFFLIAYVVLTQYVANYDPGIIFINARLYLEGNVQEWVDGYNYIYPFNNFVTFFIILLLKLFGDYASTAFQLINVFFFVVSVMAMRKTCEIIFDRDALDCQLILLLFYPYAMYVLYCYGTMIGFSLSMLALMWLAKYFKERKYIHSVASGVSILLAVLMKANYLIVLVGMILFVLFDFIYKKELKNIIVLICILSIYFIGQIGFNKVVEGVTGQKVKEGMPKLAWVAMGLLEDNSPPGWWNNYNKYVYEKNNRDKDLTNEEALKMITKRLQYFKENPKKGIHFFYKKLTSEWNNPTWECFWLQEGEMNGKGTFIKDLSQEPHNILWKKILNAIQTIINFGIILYIGQKWKHFNECSVYELMYAVMSIGAFMFFMFWEAKSQYVAPYYYMIIPYAVIGWRMLITKFAPE